MSYIRNLLIILLITIVSGCSVWDDIAKPKAYGIGDMPDGSPIFQQGWKEGCDSGIATYGNARYQQTYEFKQDINLINNQEYYRAWKDAYTYCRWYVWGWARPFNK